jgi:hypothetical protein
VTHADLFLEKPGQAAIPKLPGATGSSASPSRQRDGFNRGAARQARQAQPGASTARVAEGGIIPPRPSQPLGFPGLGGAVGDARPRPRRPPAQGNSRCQTAAPVRPRAEGSTHRRRL